MSAGVTCSVTSAYVAMFDPGMTVTFYSTSERHGADRRTLERRATYGGRKGRRAVRRIARHEYAPTRGYWTVTSVDRNTGVLEMVRR